MTRINVLNDKGPSGWERIRIRARRPSKEAAEAYRAMFAEYGVTPCAYSCTRKASHIWERTESERIVLSAKRQYRGLLSGKPYKPRKMAKGIQAAPVFHACAVHVPKWRHDNFKPFQNEPATLPAAA